MAIPENTARTLAEYTAWVRQCREMTVEEATTSTIDYALREVFRRDRLWREQRRKGEGAPTPRRVGKPFEADLAGFVAGHSRACRARDGDRQGT